MQRHIFTLPQKVFIVKNYYQITDMFEVRKAFSRSYSIEIAGDAILETFFKVVTQFELTGSVTQAVYYESPWENAKECSPQQSGSPTRKGRARKAKKDPEGRIILSIPESEEDEPEATPTESFSEAVQDGDSHFTDGEDVNINVDKPETRSHEIAKGDEEQVPVSGEESYNVDDELSPIGVDESCQTDSEDSVVLSSPKGKRVKASPIKKPRIECPICLKTYTKEFIRSHMLKHDRLGCTYECQECNTTFNKYEELQLHQESHIPVIKYKFKCPTCRQKFVSEEKLNLHQKWHSAPKQFICEHCGMTFNTQDSLRVHTRTHTGEKPLKCSKCEESFAFYGGLKAHMKKHDGGSYKCNYCDKTFVYKAERNLHQKEHMGSKPYVCHICSRGCVTAANLRSHLKILHKVEMTLEEIQLQNYKAKEGSSDADASNSV